MATFPCPSPNQRPEGGRRAFPFASFARAQCKASSCSILLGDGESVLNVPCKLVYSALWVGRFLRPLPHSGHNTGINLFKTKLRIPTSMNGVQNLGIPKRMPFCVHSGAIENSVNGRPDRKGAVCYLPSHIQAQLLSSFSVVENYFAVKIVVLQIRALDLICGSIRI